MEPELKFNPQWRRFVLRMRARAAWHIKGIVLWLVQRSYLRFLPFPWPASSTLEAWEEQAKQMALQFRTLPRAHYAKAASEKKFTARHLLEMTWLRNRLGLKLCFLEDPLLQGMLAGRAQKGLASQIKKEAAEEAKQLAIEAKAKGKTQNMVREILGPRGGLPTLRCDLLKLAALMDVKVDGCTVAEMKDRLRPLVHQMYVSPPPPSSKAASSNSPPVPRPKPLAAPKSVAEAYLTAPPPAAFNPFVCDNGIGRENYRMDAADGRSQQVMEVDDLDGQEMTEEDWDRINWEQAGQLNEDRAMGMFGVSLDMLNANEFEAVVDP